jgi:SpoVK/Ycf46/Vps4 family AAA+-type ATPase
MENLLRDAARRLSLPLFVWRSSEGLRRIDLGEPIYGTKDIHVALKQVEAYSQPALYCFHGTGQFKEDRAVRDRLVDVITGFASSEAAIVCTGSEVSIPDAARAYSAAVTIPGPEPDDFRDLIKAICRDLRSRTDARIDLTARSMNVLLRNLKGLTLVEAEKILTRAFVEDGRLDEKDIELVMREKRAIVERTGLLEFIPAGHGFSEIADLESLKAWLAKRKNIISDPEGAAAFGLPFPRGILLLGIPGSGKSLCAKAVAMEWGLPLLRMDPARLYNKYIGESEKNYRRAMEIAEKLAPVVLWIDEIEKAFPPGDSEDSGVSQRVLGSFLTWMQERRGDVFVTATANDIDRLPAEFLRKGRFDEIFFVDLPDRDVRSEIFRIHLGARGHDPGRIDLDMLAEATSGFTGAEIEQVVVSALYTAFSGEACLSTELLLSEIHQTRPLSVTRAEYIQALREWAAGRTVSAH